VKIDRPIRPEIGEVHARGFDRCTLRCNIGTRLLCGRGGVVRLLLADRVQRDELAVTLRLESGRIDLRLRGAKLALRSAERGAIGGVLDLVEDLARTDHRALGEQATADDARHLRPHFGRLHRGNPPRQLGGERHRLLRDRHDADRGRRRGRGGLFLAARRHQRQRGQGHRSLEIQSLHVEHPDVRAEEFTGMNVHSACAAAMDVQTPGQVKTSSGVEF
jgi:hypothetical protein